MTDESVANASAAAALTAEEAQASYEAWWAERKAKGLSLQRNSRRVWAAMEGWQRVKSPEDWARIQGEAAEDWVSGRALLTMLGGERYLAPERAALLVHLWRHFLVAYEVDSPAEFLTVAMALVAFNQLTRVNELIGNIEARLEDEFFALRAQGGDAGGGGDRVAAGPGPPAAARPLQPHGHPQPATLAGAEGDAAGGDGGELRAAQPRAKPDQHCPTGARGNDGVVTSASSQTPHSRAVIRMLWCYRPNLYAVAGCVVVRPRRQQRGSSRKHCKGQTGATIVVLQSHPLRR